MSTIRILSTDWHNLQETGFGCGEGSGAGEFVGEVGISGAGCFSGDGELSGISNDGGGAEDSGGNASDNGDGGGSGNGRGSIYAGRTPGTGYGSDRGTRSLIAFSQGVLLHDQIQGWLEKE